MKKYYLAYGSNLSVYQMAQRCPDAIYIGTAEIPDYRLLFKGSQTGSYLTIEKKKGRMVPVLVWEISPLDEKYLDRYEGCPAFYYKKEMRVSVTPFIPKAEPVELDAIVYIMHEERQLGCPSEHYYEVCAEGYRRFGFAEGILKKALKESVEKEAVIYG